MNIFATSPDPFVAATYLDDKRVNKMTIESAQIICTALYSLGYEVPYRPTHKNRLVVLWAGESSHNMSWLLRHHIALAQVYQSVYRRRHLSFIKVGLPFSKYIRPDEKPTSFVNEAQRKELGIDFTNEPDVHIAYQKYLAERWKIDKTPPTWIGRPKPYWIN